MTQEEAREILNILKEYERAYQYSKEEVVGALDMAIQALEKQPCKDCISREQAVYVASGYCAPQNIADELRKLPSVTPQPKRGKWIQHNEDIECSICHTKWDWLDNEIHKFDFCPKCGADMRGDINEIS